MKTFTIILQICFLVFKFWMKKNSEHDAEDEKLREELKEIKKIEDKKEKSSRLNALINRVNQLHK